MSLNGAFILLYKDEVNTIKIRPKNKGKISQTRSLRGTMTRGMYYYYILYARGVCVPSPVRIHARARACVCKCIIYYYT